MFGSDRIIWPELIEKSIAIINETDFLNHEQKADNNAARFLGWKQQNKLIYKPTEVSE